ncbi:hypothetical protein [Thermococcus sp.]
MKFRSCFAILLGLLIINSSWIFVGAKSFTSQSAGIYDPHPTFKDDLKDAIPLSARLNIDIRRNTGNLKGKIFIGNRDLPVEKRFSLVRSTVFDGYVMIFNNNPADKLLGLQGNIYKNGTIFLFFKDKKGGLLFIRIHDTDILPKLSKLSIPRKNIDKNEWLWKLGPAVVKTKTITTRTIRNSITSRDLDSSGPVTVFSGSDWASSTFVTKWFEVGWWIFTTKYFITLELRVYGPPYITHSSPQMIYQTEVKIYNEGTESGSGDTPLLIGDSALTGPEAVEMGMVVPEECDRIILVSQHSASRYVVNPGVSLGFSLGPISLDPITAISLILSGGLYDDIEPTNPANALHIKYSNMYALYPGEYIGTREIIVNYEYQQYSGIKPFKVKFRAPVYYQLSSSQGLQKVGVIEGTVYHYVTHNNTS